MNELQKKRCFHHPQREAVARCPECRGFFCRECIVDHESRALCADCMARLSASRASGRGGHRFIPPLYAVAGLIWLWFVFYAFGRILLALPSSFHEGDIWAQPAEWMAP